MTTTAKQLDLAQQACAAVGVDPITSFTDGSAAANVLSQLYSPTVKGELSIFPWVFATEHFDLQPNLLSTAPETLYDTAYQMPTDPAVLSVDGVFIDDDAINFTRHQNQIHTNGTSGDNVILKYRYYANELEWTPYFDMLIIYRLATFVAFSVMRKAEVAKEMDTQAEKFYIRAKREASQSQPRRPLRLNRIRKARGGSVERFWRDR